jgi:hypothetical protein
VHHVSYFTCCAGTQFARIFEPFDESLWLATLAFLVSTALAMALIEILAPSVERERPPSQVARAAELSRDITKSFYHTLVACFGGDDYVRCLVALHPFLHMVSQLCTHPPSVHEPATSAGVALNVARTAAAHGASSSLLPHVSTL